ncbi:MAG: IS21 family transposase, partial [Erysipelotrichaceae bacterium]|nr:IS21 family transposase [Erysipelotrichaceae bacterium]
MLDATQILVIASMLENGSTYREISDRLMIGHSRVTRLKKFLLDNHLTAQDLKMLDPEALIDQLYPNRPKKKDQIPDEVMEGIYNRITAKQNKTNLFVEWRNYKAAHPDGYEYSQFNFYVNEWISENKGSPNLTMALQRPPGGAIYVDWAGDTARVKLSDGAFHIIHFFVTTLGLSSKIFVKAYQNERTGSVIDGMNTAFQYYQGLPDKICCDNMKTAVIANDEVMARLSPAFYDLEEFYDTPVIPARPRHPKDKGSVESAVHYVEENLISQIDGCCFENFQQLNQEILKRIDVLNQDTRSGRRKESRSELFEKFDKPCLRPLPDGLLEIYTYKRLRVASNSHIKIGEYQYSVPYKWYNKQVIAKIGIDEVMICSETNELIWVHEINNSETNKFTTVPEHLPEGQQKYLEYA